MNINWYINRLRRMSVGELSYRMKNIIFAYLERIRYTGYFPSPIVISHHSKILPDIDTEYPLFDNKLEIFEKELDFSNEIDWHRDPKTNNRFPLIPSPKIDIRTGKYGSAKHVWEVNRLLFLPQICLNYKKTKNNTYLEHFIKHTESWISENPYLMGVNWYSNIEVNIRLINWFMCWEILNGAELLKTNSAFREFTEKKWLPLIYLHCIYSRNHLSKYSSANNHLISEYAGLFIASTTWNFKQSPRWQLFAKKGLECEIKKQHTKNGINREEAAEYIQFITDFFVISFIVANHSGNKFSAEYEQMLKKIFEYIYEFTDSTGNYPKYGDEDDGQIFRFSKQIENNFLSLLTTGAALFNEPRFVKAKNIDLKSRLLLGNEAFAQKEWLKIKNIQNSVYYKEDGHFILRKTMNGHELYLHFDAAPLGYLSIAAHGHADALSFIMHVDGNPVFVDPGTYTYHTEPEWRKYFISTLAHNTVCINGKNQAQFGGSTLWITHYNTKVIEAYKDDTREVISASHDGYQKMGIDHVRKIELNHETNIITITDTISSNRSDEYKVEIPFHLFPDMVIKKETDHSFLLENKHVKLNFKVDDRLSTHLISGSTSPVLGWYSESFQKIKPTSVIMCSKLVKYNVQFIFEIRNIRDY